MKLKVVKTSKKKERIQHKTVVLDGITFKSTLEAKVYQNLKDAGFHPMYEPTTFILWKGRKVTKPSFKDGKSSMTKKGTIRPLEDWTYTPDFRIDVAGLSFFIEVKGRPNEVYPYKKKLCLALFEHYPTYYFFEVRDISKLSKSIQQMEKLINVYGI